MRPVPPLQSPVRRDDPQLARLAGAVEAAEAGRHAPQVGVAGQAQEQHQLVPQVPGDVGLVGVVEQLLERMVVADGLDLSDGYFRQADLRGVDLSKTKLLGASIHGAKISGVYFPIDLAAEEILMSLEHGTRMRYGIPVRASKG